jgi:large subunit ribosomal protein L23
MTVELEEPFVWPEVPNLQPWGKEERKKEIQESVKANGATDSNDARDTARRLRDHVKRLLHKDVATKDYAIEMKRAQNIELNKEELERENARLKRERELAAMSRLQLWEHERTGKVVEGDDASKFKTKA